MKFIYYTNNIILGLTLLGYTMIIPGLMMQFVLGGIQVLFFFVLLFNYNKFSKKMKKYLHIYGVLASSFLLWYFIDIKTFSSSFLMTILFPMSIASYFTYIVYQLKQNVL